MGLVARPREEIQLCRRHYHLITNEDFLVDHVSNFRR